MYCAGVLNRSNAPGPGRLWGKLSDVAQRAASREFHVSRYRSSACSAMCARRSAASLPSGVWPASMATLEATIRPSRLTRRASFCVMPGAYTPGGICTTRDITRLHGSQRGVMEPAVMLRDVRKTFGKTTAVESMTLEIPRGGLYGFIGPSGAGKTTCIRMIMSILFPDSGTLSVLGHASALEAKDRIGYLPEERGVYRKMKVGAFLTYMARLKGVSAADAETRVPGLLEAVGLPCTATKRCDDMSKGMLQRVQFVAAIVHQPELIILDEPFTGLDPLSVRLLRELIVAEHRRGATILFSTHVMSNAEEICEHIVMIHQGRKVLDEPMAGLRRQFDAHTILFED